MAIKPNTAGPKILARTKLVAKAIACVPKLSNALRIKPLLIFFYPFPNAFIIMFLNIWNKCLSQFKTAKPLYFIF